jgi:hypothetical protein
MSEDKYLTKLAALLRQAESTDNDHEAEAFMAAAQMLATTTSIELAVARAHIAKRERRSSPTAKRIEIGPSGKRALRTYVQLFLAIAAANGITCDLASNSTYVIAYGFDSDIDVVEACTRRWWCRWSAPRMPAFAPARTAPRRAESSSATTGATGAP